MPDAARVMAGKDSLTSGAPSAPKLRSIKAAITNGHGAPMTEASLHPALEIRDLAKCFDRPAVDGLNLCVRAGEFYVLLGPNGAGKTTTLRMATGLLKPDRGSVTVFGIDVLADPVGAKQLMAWLSDEPMIYERLTPIEYLYFVAGLWGIDHV